MNLSCENINKTFGSVVALHDASLSVASGEVRALLGGNGSGKSTLAKILGGVIAPDSGVVRLDGTPFVATSPISSKRKHLVITSQELSLFNNLSVIENLNVFRTPCRFGLFSDRKKMQERALEMLRYLHLESIAGQPVGSLPPNQLYMLELAKALLQDPEVLVIDEVTSALFREDVKVVKSVLKDLKEKGVAVIFISHRMSEIMDLSDKVTVMRNGEILGTFETGETTPDQLLSLMTGRDSTAGYPEADAAKLPETEVILSLKEYPLAEFDSRISLDLHKGEIIGIAGLQGHGQSTLIRKIYGLYGSEDKITYQGKTVANTTPMAAVKRRIGFLSGDRVGEGVFGERSVAENVNCVTGLIFNRKSAGETEVLKQFNVKYKSTGQLITSLSGGNQQKVVMARWMSADLNLLLADDPTKGIDVQARRDIHKILCDMSEAGTAIMMVSSDDEELVELTRMAPRARVIVMYEGAIIKELRGNEITVQNIINYSLADGGEQS